MATSLWPHEVKSYDVHLINIFLIIQLNYIDTDNILYDLEEI